MTSRGLLDVVVVALMVSICPAAQAQLPDLHPTDAYVNGLALAGQRVETVHTIVNQGTGPILTSRGSGGVWADRLYLSSNSTWDTNAVLLNSFIHYPPLAAGESYTVTNRVVWPAVPSGDYYLIVRADISGGGYVDESDEDNNDAAFPIHVVIPDLHPTDAHVNGIAVAGQRVETVHTIVNQGTGPILTTHGDGYVWADRLYLSSNSTWDTNAVLLNSFIHYPPLAAGESYTVTNRVVWPAVPSGDYYLIVRADISGGGYVDEADEDNNDVAFPIHVVIPDLHPTDAHVNGIAIAGQRVETVHTIVNQGTGPILTTHGDGYVWADRLYLSSNSTWDTNAVLLNSFIHYPPLAAGQSYTITNSIGLPAVPSGDYYLIVRADISGGGYVDESDEDNNDVAFPVQVVAPDLHPTDAHVNEPAVGGQSVKLLVTVENRGDGPIPSGRTWSDRVYLSSNATLDASAATLVTSSRSGPFAAGQTCTFTNTVSLPLVPRGLSYLIVQLDYLDAIGEAHEDNNVAAFPLWIVDPVLDKPIAEAGPDRASLVGQPAVFDGSASSNAQHYTWTLLSRPPGSSSEATGLDTPTPQVIPDLPGQYIMQLVVAFHGLTSTADTVTLTASRLIWTVDSRYGQPTPGTGVHECAYGELATNSVDATVQLDQTQYVCAGWTLTGHDPAAGTNNQFVVVVTNAATLTWLWTTNYWLQVDITGSGTLSHASGWYPSGSTQSVTDVTSNGWLLTGWTGDISAGHSVSNIDMVMNRPWHLVVSYSDDPDGDGLKNLDEWIHGSDPWNPDTDSDGFDDAWEVLHGWNPAVADADVLPYILAHPGVFGVYSASNIGSLHPGALFIVASNNAVHMSIQLEESSELEPTAWTNAGPPVEWSMTVATNKAFYRVGIRE